MPSEAPRLGRTETRSGQAPSKDDDRLDARTRRLYVWAIVCEAIVIAALWAFTRAYS